ncbi:MAG: T9SS type A sorting domain-containing protein [Vicingaceae bacterium]
MKALFLTFIAFCSVMVHAQTEAVYDSTKEYVEWKTKRKNAKAVGDTLYYEDFDSTGRSANNYLPLGWTSVDNTSQNHKWIWSDQPPGGQYSTTIGTLNSPTATNGYLCMPADLYNTPPPSGGFVQMDATIQSSAISITPSAAVQINFRQFYRYCCQQQQSNLSLEVSSDGVNWVEYFNNTVISQSTMPPNGNIISVDVSPTLAYQSTVYIRFRFNNASHYFWMIDDLAIIEGAANAFSVNALNLGFGHSYLYEPTYTQLPIAMVDSISTKTWFENRGVNDQTSMKVDLNVYHDSDLLGNQGSGLLFQDSVLLAQPFPAYSTDTVTFDHPKFKPNQKGIYRFEVSLSSDSINQIPQEGFMNKSFKVSDSILARDSKEFYSQGIGPANYVGSGNDGDKWGVLFNGAQRNQAIKALRIFVATNTNVGVQIRPLLWEFNQNASTLTAAMSLVAQDTALTTITSNMLGKWIDLPFSQSGSLSNLTISPNKQYVIGWEEVNAGSGLQFRAGRDNVMESSVPDVTNFVYINDASPSWGWVSAVAAVRAVFEPNVVGISEVSQKSGEFQLYPNPNHGQFNLSLESGTDFQAIELHNLKGQLIRRENLNSESRQSFDFSQLESGIYLISVIGEKGRATQKLVIH